MNNSQTEFLKREIDIMFCGGTDYLGYFWEVPVPSFRDTGKMMVTALEETNEESSEGNTK